MTYIFNKTESDMLDDEYLDLFYALNGVELFLVIISVIVFFISSYIIIETPLLHINFMRLYKCLCVEFCIFTLARMIKLVAVLNQVIASRVDKIYVENGPSALLKAGFFGWLEVVRLGGGFAAGCLLIFLLFERVLATIMLKTYEAWTNDGISFIFIVIHIFVSITSTTIFFSEMVPFTIEASVVIFGIMLCLVILFLLRYYNVRQYERSKLENTRYTLSEKFQISENIRSIAILSRVSLAAVAFVVLIVLLFALTAYVDNALLKRLIFFAFNDMVPLFITISQCIIISTNHIWRRSLNIKLVRLKKFICSKKISNELQAIIESFHDLRTLDGQRMVYPIDEERELYFHQLFRDWNKE